ncbi:hypothetical protein OEZ85_000055 [Tetradesmus obliquus]|uniref:Secreted protein n=1 Tax=Tetradesmus obliquus TaxID=3088 RepID=A0ABY8UQ84_TETOB|nr:hypothetical protein OEZ85_000055 [Tetradesmus obliquus]
MRASTAAACCTLALLLITLPVNISAFGASSDAATHEHGRQLLVVNDNVTSATTTAAASSGESQSSSGAAASTVGADFNPPQPDSKAPASGATDPTQEAAVRAARQQARSSRRQQQQQQGRVGQRQRALGRKGGPAVRQSAPGQAAAVASPGGGSGGSGSGSGDDLPRVFVGDLDDYALPFCQPSEGVVCSDRDKTSLLKSQPAVISLENAYPYAQVKPAASYAGSSVTTLDFLADTFSNRNQGVTKAALETLAGTEAVNADTTVTTTALQGTVDASRLDRPIPDAVSVVADRTATQGTYEWKSWRPRFTYQIGANYGLPVGLATVTDTSGK